MNKNKANNCYDSCDLFSTAVKPFNFEGRQRVHSCLGLCCTVILSFIMINLTLNGVVRLMSDSFPTVNQITYFDQYSSEGDTLSFEKENF